MACIGDRKYWHLYQTIARDAPDDELWKCLRPTKKMRMEENYRTWRMAARLELRARGENV